MYSFVYLFGIFKWSQVAFGDSFGGSEPVYRGGILLAGFNGTPLLPKSLDVPFLQMPSNASSLVSDSSLVNELI